ncbi:metallophosphoesterase [bacterium]|nr:metallophosphoesterase [bacterium]
MRILFASDLHGRQAAYDELIRMAGDYGPELFILGGDLLPAGRHAAELLKSQTNFAAHGFRRFLAGLRDAGNPRVIASAGNYDLASAFLELKNLEDDHFTVFLSTGSRALDNGFRLVCSPFVPPTPFPPKDFERLDMPDDAPAGQPSQGLLTWNGKVEFVEAAGHFKSRKSIREELQSLSASAEHEKTIAVFHSPPHGTGLDRLYGGAPVGSRAVRSWIEETKPLVSLHGHIHESPDVTGIWAEHLGATLAVNPGQNTSRVSAVVLDTENPGGILHSTRGRLGDSGTGRRS